MSVLSLPLLCAWLCAASDEPPPGEPPSFETVVTGEARAARTATERVLDERAVATSPGRSGDDLLRLVPGLVVSRHGGEGKAPQLFLRGFDAEHGADVEVLLDGIPLNERSNVHGNGYLDLTLVLPEAVRQIDVRRGPFSLEQGGFATAGTVGFQLGVTEEDVGTRVGTEIGSTGRGRVALLHAPRPHDFVAVEAMRDEGFAPNRYAERAVGIGRWTLVDFGSARVSLLAAAQAARFGDPGVAPLPDVEAGRLGFYETWRRDTGGRSLRALVSPSLEWARGKARANVRAWGQARDLVLEHDYTGFFLDEELGDRRRQQHRSLGGGLKADGSVKLGGPARVRGFGGLSYSGEAISREERAVPADGTPGEVALDERGVQHGLGVFAGLGARPWTWLRVEGGARVDAFSGSATEASAAIVSPRLTVQVRPIPALKLFAAAGRGVRPPDLQVARAVTAESAEVGVGLGLPRVRADVALFGTRVREELRFDHLSSTLIDQGQSRRVGVDAGLRWDPTAWLELRLEGTAARATLIETDTPVPGVPTLTGSVFASLVHPNGLRGGARLTGVGERPLPYGAVASGYAVLDAQAGYRFAGGGAEVHLAVDNVTGARYREGEYLFPSRFDRSGPSSALPVRHFSPGHPRAVRAGVSLFF